LQELITQQLRPQRLDLGGLGEEPMAADVEAKPVVLSGPRNPADVVGVRLKDDDRFAGLRQQIAGREARGPGADDDRLCFRRQNGRNSRVGADG
jgi:hypothetical protein